MSHSFGITCLEGITLGDNKTMDKNVFEEPQQTKLAFICT
jgi:hypothetical protein